MPWTTPRTWTTSQLVTANELNTDVRDNLNYLYDRKNIVEDYHAGTFSMNNQTFIKAGTADVTLTTIGKPVLLIAEIGALRRTSASDRVILQWYNDISSLNVGSEFYCEFDKKTTTVLTAVDIPNPGTYRWFLRWRVTNSLSGGEIENLRLRAIELM